MARNQVQFQKGLSEARFAEIYGAEEQCHAALVKWRWPNGFEGPGAIAPITAWSRAACGAYFSVTRIAGRPRSRRLNRLTLPRNQEKFSLVNGCYHRGKGEFN